MDKPKTLLMTGAHPDDETFGVGGTLAHYAAAAVKVYYVCGTRGEVGEVTPEAMKGYSSIADLRTHELQCAAEVLGLADVIYLGYRDSGMAGTADNKHSQALAAAPVEEVADRVVSIIRRLQPQVIITSDPVGGYHHPDHIAIHNATVKAFHAANDAAQYPAAGPPFQPQKLYFHVFPHRWLKVMVKIQTLLGRDPHRFGRNKAAACHASQLFGGSPRGGIMGLLNRLFGQKDSFMRAYPPVTRRRRERDLFEGVS